MKLILHIGTPKTGTTTLQRLLFKNKKVLQDKYKTCYPGGSQWQHRLLEQFDLANPDVKDNIRAVLNEYVNEGKENNCETIILSHEGLYGLYTSSLLRFGRFDNDATELNSIDEDEIIKDKVLILSIFKDICIEFFSEIDIVAYFRPQSEFIKSLYLQYVKNSFVFPIDDFNLYRYELNYAENIELWQSIFDEARFVIRDYNEIKATGTEYDFLTLYNYEHSSFLLNDDPKKEQRLNLSLDLNTYKSKLKFNHIYQNQVLTDKGYLAKYFESLTNRYLKGSPRSKAYKLPIDKANELLERYSNSNEHLAKKFLNKTSIWESNDTKQNDVSPEHEVFDNLVTISDYKLLSFYLASTVIKNKKLEEQLKEQKTLLTERIDALQVDLQMKFDSTFYQRLKRKIFRILKG